MKGRAFALLGAGLAVAAVARAGAAAVPEPSPYAVLPSRVTAPPALDATPACAPPGRELPAAIAAARAGAAPRQARGDLEALALESEPAVRACARLELARLDLAERRLPEAGLQVRRARRAFGARGLPPELGAVADFQRAEVLARSGRFAEAEPLYEALAEAAPSRLRDAARLRLAEARVASPDAVGPRGADGPVESDGDYARFAELLARVGADPGDWAPRAAELAIAAGELAGARDWLERAVEADLEPTSAGLVAVRRADVLLALGEREPAARALREIADHHAEPRVRVLASVRLLHTGLAPEDDSALRRLLVRAAQGDHANLATYARGVWVGRLRAEGELAGALDVLVQLATDSKAPELAPDFGAQVDATLADAAGPQVGCAVLVERLGGRRALLLRQAGAAGPFLRLGDCYLELGFARAALDDYRAVTRRFGVGIAGKVSLRSARAAFEAGEPAAARAPAVANLARAAEGRPVDALGAWTLLLARVEMQAGAHAEVVALLEPALRDGLLDPAREPSALRLLALAALRGAPDAATGAAVRATLRRALAERPRNEAPGLARLRDEALLHAADLHRRAGDRQGARALYRRAAEALEPGPLGARAGYWAGALAPARDVAEDAWRRAAAAERGGPWARLAGDEVAANPLREAIGSTRAAARGSRVDAAPAAPAEPAR